MRNGDVPGAYLNANIDDDTEIYITQPKGFEVEGKKDWVYRLDKALYGLKQAGQLWNSLLHSFLLKINFKQNIADPCLYYKRSKGELLVLVITVDDFLYFGTGKQMVDEFVESLTKEFDYIDEGKAEWFLGMKIEQDYENVRLSQEDYINTITKEWPKAYKTNLPAKPSIILQPTRSPKNPKFPYRKLRVRAIPENLPDFINADISKLKIGDKLYVTELQNDAFTIMHPDNTVVVQVRLSRAVVLDEDEEDEEGEEGAEGAEGAPSAEGAPATEGTPPAAE